MKRSKSLNFLSESTGVVEQNDGQSDAWEITKSLVDDSGIQSNDGLISLEKKLDKLNDMCIEQTSALSELTELVRKRQQASFSDEQLAELFKEMLLKLSQQRESSDGGTTENGGAQSLLSAIESRPSLERRICEAVADLLHSENLQERLISATVASIKEEVQALFARQASALVPLAERSHRQLLKHVSKLMVTAFTDLEESITCSAGVLFKAAENLQPTLQRHESLLQETNKNADRMVDAVAATTEKVLRRELKYWHDQMLSVLPRPEFDNKSGRAESPTTVSSTCTTPDQSVVDQDVEVNTPLSPVDRMMITAEINKLIKEGNVNGALRKALLRMDMPLVEAACRAAAPTLPDRPALTQPVLLSLLQQLATDLVVETQLKCSFMEYALQNLNPAAPVTRMHLAFVVGELDKHITKFFTKWPNHTLFERISHIIVTARNLI